jgi:hypothetical protein
MRQPRHRPPLLIACAGLLVACQYVIGLDSKRDRARIVDKGQDAAQDATPGTGDSGADAAETCADVDLATDPNNCGACEHRCGKGRACSKSLCEPEPLVALNGVSSCLLVREDAPVMVYDDRLFVPGTHDLGGGKLVSSGIDGRNPVILRTDMNRRCGGLLVDNGKLFVGLDGPGAVERMELNGSGRTPLWSGHDRLYKMVIRDGVLYLATNRGVVRLPAHGPATAGELFVSSAVGTSLMDVSAEHVYYGLETPKGPTNDLTIYAAVLDGGATIPSPKLGYNAYLRAATWSGTKLYFGLGGSVFSYALGDVPINVVTDIAPSEWMWNLWSDGTIVYAQNRPGRLDEGTIARVDPVSETYLRLAYGNVFESPWGFDKTYVYFMAGISRDGVEDARKIVRVPR